MQPEQPAAGYLPGGGLLLCSYMLQKMQQFIALRPIHP